MKHHFTLNPDGAVQVLYSKKMLVKNYVVSFGGSKECLRCQAANAEELSEGAFFFSEQVKYRRKLYCKYFTK